MIGGATSSEPGIPSDPVSLAAPAVDSSRSRQVVSVARIVRSLLLFTLVVLVVFPAFAYVGWRRSGADGVAAAGVAASLCWASAGASLVLLGASLRKSQLLVGVLGGMLLRMAPPLVACFVFVSNSDVLGDGGSLAKASAGGMTLIYYLVALSVETLLSVRLAAPAIKSGGVDSKKSAAV